MKNHSVQKIIVYLTLYIVTVILIASVFLWGPHGRNDYPLLRLFIIFFSTILLTKYFIYMAVSPWYDVFARLRRREVREHMPGTYNPRVSVVIAALNEEVGLVATVRSILKSTYRNVEIVVVNDGSTDSSDARMREFIASYNAETADSKKIDIVYQYKENGGKGRALNRAIGLSSGDIIISIDADCVLLPSTIGNFVKYFEDPEIMAAVGNVKIGNTEHLLGTLQYLEFLFSFYFKKADSLFGTIYIIGGAAGAFRREVFEHIGFYNPKNITEDIDLSVRIQEAGMRIAYASDAIVYTEGAGTLEGLLQQRLRWKRGRFQTFFDHRRLFFSSNARHNILLTWLVLPLAVFGDLQLFFEIFFVAFLYIYSLLVHDFSSFISGIIVVSAMFLVQIFDDRSNARLRFYFLAPIGWLLFYVTTVIEYRALIKALAGIVARRKLTWQRWERTGLSMRRKKISEERPPLPR